MDNILLACSVGDIAWLKRCLSTDPNPAASRNKEGLNSLHLAAKNGHLECLRHLLNNCSISVDEPVPSSGQTALHFSISTKNGVRSLQCMKLLLERGADQNKRNKSGQTPLHIAAKKGHTKCLKRLLEQGSDFDIMDNDEHTACDIATLHGHYECARLLQALHWAKRKDNALRSELQSKTAQQRQERERSAIHARLRKEAADAAYSNWACKKAKPIVQPPGACKERQELRSQPQTPHTCSSCVKTGTRKHSAKEAGPQLTSPVTVSMHQAKRNTESTGKPDKMHPYTNYPPRKQKAKTPRKPTPRSGRQSRTAKSSTRKSTPTPTNTDCSSVRGQSPQPDVQHSIASERIDETHTDSQPQHEVGRNSYTSDCPSDCNEFDPPCELNLGFLKASATQSEVHSRESEDQVGVHFLVGGTREEDSEEEEEREEEEGKEGEEGEEEEEEGEEDIAFHDVGKANSLNALALPSILTRDQTPAEVIQLLRCLGNHTFFRNHGRSRSYSSHFNRRPSLTNRLQRRFSLGAIPEGQMVTNYSNESVSSLDSQSVRLRYGDAAWEEEEEDNQTLQNGDDYGEWSSIFEGEEREEGEEGMVQVEEKEEDEEEGGRKEDVHRNEEGDKVEEGEEDEDEESQLNGTASDDHTPLNTTNDKPMLSIVNFAWDSTSNSIQTKVTKSSMVPANHLLQGRIRHSRPVALSSRPRPVPQRRSHSPSSPGTSPCLSPLNHFTLPDTGAPSPLTPKSTPPKFGVQTSSNRGRRSLSPGPSPLSSTRDLAEVTDEGRKNGRISPGLKLPTLTLSHRYEAKVPEPVATSVAPNTPQNTLFPAHSLFGGMSSLASKSMISFGTPSTLLPSSPGDSTNTVSHTQPKLHRRIKSAPNMLNLQHQNGESRPLKTSTFTYGGRLE